MDEVRFYFSFRSPYAWLAFHRAPVALARLPVKVRPIPVFPPPDYPNDPAAVPAKLRYMREQDLPRLAERYGLPFSPPQQTDLEWMQPHAMWIHADDAGKGDAFGKAVFAARFSRGMDLAAPETYRELASEVGLDPDATVAAGDDPKLQERVMLGMLGAVEDGIFGVPHFAYRQERFWGHDRIPWLLRSIRRDHGLPEQTPMLWT